MPNVKRTENDRFIGESFQTKKGYMIRQPFAAPATASTTAIHAAANSTAVLTTGITNPDMPRLLTVVSAGSGHNAAGTVTINGTDIRGNTISDAIVLNGNTAVAGVKAFKTVTSIDLSGVTGNDANNTVAVGTSAKLGLSRICQEDSAFLGSSDGVFEATRPVITKHATDISQNVVSFNTAPNGAKNLTVWYGSIELTTAA